MQPSSPGRGRLRLIVHAAGTIKGLVGESVFDAGSRSATRRRLMPCQSPSLPRSDYFRGQAGVPLRDCLCGRPRARSAPRFSGRSDRKSIAVPWDRRGIADRAPRDRAAASTRLSISCSMIRWSATAKPWLSRQRRSISIRLMARSDIVSLHAPLLPETRHMIDNRQLALMKDGRDADQHGARRVGG